MHLFDQLKSQLNPEQREAVEYTQGSLLVLAGAGSGKTRVITFRIVNLLEHGVPASAILGLTFTNKAAGEMKERVCQLTQCQVLICTFHSLGARILREVGHVLGYKRDFTIYDAQDVEKLIKLCLEELGIPSQKQEARMYKDMISSAKNALVAPGTAKAQDSDERLFNDVYTHYQAKLREYHAMDFDDLLYLPARIFEEHPEVLLHYQQRWSHLLIDEYQDTNEAQFAIVRQLVAGQKNICVVGDPDQSIYSWRGANIDNILNFQRDFPGAKIVRLEQNYRSCSNILEAANALIENNPARYEKKLWSDLGPGETIKRFTGDTDRSEAEFVAATIRHYQRDRGVPLSHIAVFYRTNAQSRSFEDRLVSARIPYIIVGGVSFYQRREIKDILAYLRMVQSGSDFISFERTINLPKRGLGGATLEKIRLAATQEGRAVLNYCEELIMGSSLQHPVRLSAKQREGLSSYVKIIRQLREESGSSSLKEMVRGAIEKSGYLEYLKEDKETLVERMENLNALITKAQEWEISTEEPTLAGFLEELSLKSTLDEADGSQDRVHLMTIHNAKGLEFTVVFLVGLEEDLFPHANSRESVAALEEERRLCYVGMTRAKEFLYLCNVRQRLLWGTTRTQRPSRFLLEVPGKYMERVSLGAGAVSASTKQSMPSIRRQAEQVRFMDDVEQPFPEEELSINDAVYHNQFGMGMVRRVHQSTTGVIYTVLFSKDNSERSFVGKMAALKKL